MRAELEASAVPSAVSRSTAWLLDAADAAPPR
jgi:hypothetical protein